jgi:hypothetical protein
MERRTASLHQGNPKDKAAELAARPFSVSTTLVQNAIRVRYAATPEIRKAVKDGRMSVMAALNKIYGDPRNWKP